MNQSNLKNFDLNLLLALKTLLEERHISHAAERMHMSQSAMSRRLSRLRVLFQDPLLVKGADRLCLTARANELYQELQPILLEINQLIKPPATHPAKMHGEIVIATRDYETAVILPKVIKRITAQAPNLTLRVIPLLGDDLSPLERKEVDFIISGSESNASNLSRSTLFEENYLCLTANSNSITQRNFTLNRYLSMKHCLVSIKGFGQGVVDEILEEQKLKRDVTVCVPHFLAAAHIIAATDMIITLPARIGLILAKQNNLKKLQPPLQLPDFPIYLYWHVRNQSNPIHQWLRNVIKDVGEKGQEHV